MAALPILSDRLAVDVQGAQALRAGARAGDEAALRKAAQQFEAMVVNIMLKTMRETRLSDPATDPFASPSLELYRDLLDQQWASRLSETRGLGFAEMLIKRLKQEQAGSVAPPEAPAGGYPLRDEAAPQRPLRAAPETGLPLAPKAGPASLPLPERAPAAPASDAPAAPALDAVRRAFIERIRPHAEAAAAATGVPAEYIVAHAALESGWGRREIVGADGRNSHNLFGIKASGAWAGDSVEVLTTEYRYGLPMKQVQRFRAYADYAEAFADYAGLLKRRYAEALGAGSPEAFAQALARGGYATDPRYADKLTAVLTSTLAAWPKAAFA